MNTYLDLLIQLFGIVAKHFAFYIYAFEFLMGFYYLQWAQKVIFESRIEKGSGLCTKELLVRLFSIVEISGVSKVKVCDIGLYLLVDQ